MELEEKFELKQVVSIYQKKPDEDSGYGHVDYYVEQHDVTINGDKPLLGAGRPLEKKMIRELTKAVMLKNNVGVGFFPPNLLSYDDKIDTKLLWWSPPGRRQLFFHKGTKIPNGTANCPALLFYVKGQKLNVWALKRKRRPTLKTRVYAAPFPNVGHRGSVCMGTAKIPEHDVPAKMMHEWERSFFLSEFSNSSYLDLWNSLIDTDNPFPVDQLKKAARNLGSLIEHFEL